MMFTPPPLFNTAFLPTALSGLTGWWDASDESSIAESSDRVSQINDLSGNGNHGVQGTGANQPLTGQAGDDVNGLNVLSFAGDPEHLTTSLTLADESWRVAIAVADAQATGGSTLRTVYDELNGSDLGFSLGLPTADESRKFFVYGEGGASDVAYSTEDWEVGTTVLLITSREKTVDAIMHEGVAEIINTTAAKVVNNATDSINIFGSPDTLSRCVIGQFCEGFVGSGTLSASDRSNITAYAAAKWGTPA